MPSKSAKQHRLMEAVAHNKDFAKKVGISQSVGKEFAKADKGRRFGTGGSANITYGGKGQINKQRTRFGSQFGNKLNVPNENLNKYEGMASGGMAGRPDLQKVNKQKTDHGKNTLFKKGGIMKESKAMELRHVAAMKKAGVPKKIIKEEQAEANAMKKGGRIASKGEHSVQKQSKRGAEIVKMAKGGLAGGHKSADGCAVRGKTRAMMPAMKRGGKC